ncbi:MAG TPA: phosphoserine phosphatase SerB [Hyphomicrobiaceae bacterium]|nr:phosphoserine phosphatase SerB [Hyphomicrobiaceae bacterium]
MSFVTTLVAPSSTPAFDNAPLGLLEAAGIVVESRHVRAKDRAVDVLTTGVVAPEVLNEVRARFRIDAICQDLATRGKSLLLADMDATMVAEETLDELAGYAGLKDRIATITARAMNGELDFEAALRERVALLKGLPVTALEQTAGRLTFNPGADVLIRTLKAHGVHCALVSGGFTYFTGRVAAALGFDEHHGNRLEVAGDSLAGTVADPILGKAFKRHCLEAAAERLGIPMSETVAIGDGANDLPMLQAAGLGVGWRSKSVLRAALPSHILFGGLDTLLYCLGLEPVA